MTCLDDVRQIGAGGTRASNRSRAAWRNDFDPGCAKVPDPARAPAQGTSAAAESDVVSGGRQRVEGRHDLTTLEFGHEIVGRERNVQTSTNQFLL